MKKLEIQEEMSKNIAVIKHLCIITILCVKFTEYFNNITKKHQPIGLH